MQDDCIAVALGLPQLKILRQQELEDHIEVTIIYRRGEARCPRCGKVTHKEHDRRQQHKQDRRLRDKVLYIPNYHKTVPNILNGISSVGMVLSIWAIVTLSIWPAILGISLAYLGKSWYLDRMVWIYEDMKHLPEYGIWLYSLVNKGY